MRQLPLSDQLPYRFYPPELNPLVLGLARFYIPYNLRHHQRIEEVDIAGIEHLAPLLERGDGVLLTPNHPDHSDCFVMFELGRRLRMPFYYMAAHQLFAGKKHWVLPRIGVFPVDREGASLTAFKTGAEILARGRNPLVIFPEGEIYQTADRLTPIREGAVAVAVAAEKRLAAAGKKMWIVPVALKYRFLEGHDPLPALCCADGSAGGAVHLASPGPSPAGRPDLSLCRGDAGAEGVRVPRRRPSRARCWSALANLRGRILDRVEDRRGVKRRDDPIPVRVKELRRACLDALARPETTPEEARSLRSDLHDLFTVMQLFSYPGDYVRQGPTLERAAETLMKFEEDLLGVDMPTPRGPRRAVVRLGEPIDVRARMSAGGRPRQAASELTTELESRMQSLLDTIGPGRPLAAGGRRRAGGASASELFGVGVVLGRVAEPLGRVAQVPAAPPVVRHAVDDHERPLVELGLDGAIEEADQVAVGQPHGPRPFVGQGLGEVRPDLDPAQPERDEGQVEGRRQALAEPFADELGRPVGAVGARRQVDGDRHVAELLVSPHRVVRAGEDQPLDPGQRRGVEDVAEGVEVGPLHLLPRRELVGVGRQVDDRVDAAEMRDPFLVELGEVGDDHIGVALARPRRRAG